MFTSNQFDVKKREEIWAVLNTVSLDLLDPYRAYDEISQSSPALVFADHFLVNEENLDEFDWSGIKFEGYGDSNHDYQVVNNQVQEIPLSWTEICREIEASIAAGYFWDEEPVEYQAVPLINPLYSRLNRNNRREAKHDVSKLFRQWDRLPANVMDILSPDDLIFENNYRIVNNFELNVPLKIYSQDEEFVIKADLPDIVFNNMATEEVAFPEQLNFKSVLAMLPDRINTKQLQPTFIDGQFRLELPKRDEQKAKKIR